MGRPDEARPSFQALLDAHLDDATDRLALVSLEALGKGLAGQRVLSFLYQQQPLHLSLLDLSDLLTEQPDWATIRYLLGRQLFNLEEYDRAARFLLAAWRLGLPHPALTSEALRLLGQSYYHLNLPDPAFAAFFALALFPRNQGDLLWALTWTARVAFDLCPGISPRR